MNGAIISAAAALTGSALGGITPLVSNYLIQRGLTERELLNRELAERETLYSDFIQFATKVYANAATTHLEDLNELVALYALISRIRLFATAPVVRAAEELATLIVKRYGEKDLSVEDLRNATLTSHADPLNSFSIRCRDELQLMLRSGKRSFSRTRAEVRQ